MHRRCDPGGEHTDQALQTVRPGFQAEQTAHEVDTDLGQVIGIRTRGLERLDDTRLQLTAMDPDDGRPHPVEPLDRGVLSEVARYRIRGGGHRQSSIRLSRMA